MAVKELAAKGVAMAAAAKGTEHWVEEERAQEVTGEA